MLHEVLEEMIHMICSNCGSQIAETDGIFDIWDTSWYCLRCNTRWFSSDGWEEIGNLLIPSR